MTKDELKDKFAMLYNYMAVSNEPKYMMLFGEVMKDMMMWLIENKQEKAESYIETLCSIKWRQYLTKQEASEVVKNMRPSAPWEYDVWYKAMKELNLECEREYVFNRYALWVAMSQIYTDFGDTLSALFGQPLGEIPAEKLVPVVYKMALDLLTDKDERYNIRKYHLDN